MMDTLLNNDAGERSNLPADLDGLARAIEANMAEETRLSKAHGVEQQTLYTTFMSGRAEADKKYLAAKRPVRLERGRLLLAARAMVEAGGWETWCRENVKLAASDIRAVIKLARAADPVAAVAGERANATERKRKSREKATAVTDDVTAVKSAVTWVPGRSPIEPHAESVTPRGELATAEGRSSDGSTLAQPSDVFAMADARAAEHGGRRGTAETRWWKVPGLMEAEPRNAEEVKVQYNALSWLEDEAMTPIWDYNYRGAMGDKLEEAQKFFPTKKAWQEWVNAECKTCEASTRLANQALAGSRKARAAAADKVAARQARLRESFPEFAAMLAAGDRAAVELVWAAADIWEEAANAPESDTGSISDHAESVTRQCEIVSEPQTAD